VASCNPNDPCFDWKRPSFEGKSKDTQVTQVPGRYDMMHHFFFAPEKTNRAWKRSASVHFSEIFVKGKPQGCGSTPRNPKEAGGCIRIPGMTFF